MTESKVCKVEWVQDPVLGWKARIIGDCPSLDEVLKVQNPGKKRYLKRRISKE